MQRRPFWQTASVVLVVSWFLLMEPAQRRETVAHAVSIAAHQVSRLLSALDKWPEGWQPTKADRP